MNRLLRRLRPHRFGAAAPRLSVRPQVAWYWRALGLVAVLSLAVAGGLAVYDAGRQFGGFDAREAESELATLRERVNQLDQEARKLRSVASSSESTLKIERVAQEKLVQQLKQLEAENGRLREDLAFFENVSAKDRNDEGVSIYRFKVEPDVVPGEYRYWLLVTQGGKSDREFRGRLQFVVMLTQGGEERTYTLPDEETTSGIHRVVFRRFYRAEGSFRIDPGARVRGVQVKVFEQGVAQARASRSYVL